MIREEPMHVEVPNDMKEEERMRKEGERLWRQMQNQSRFGPPQPFVPNTRVNDSVEEDLEDE